MRNLSIFAGLALLFVVSSVAQAGNCCPDCGTKVCTVKWVEKTVKKKVYRVECKDICVPSIRLPWQMCFEPKCGKVRTIKVLKTVELKCKKCGCEWSVQKLGGSGKAATGCGCSDCASKVSGKTRLRPQRKSTSSSFAQQLPSLEWFLRGSKAQSVSKARRVSNGAPVKKLRYNSQPAPKKQSVTHRRPVQVQRRSTQRPVTKNYIRFK